MASRPPMPDQVTLQCVPSKEGGVLRFAYQVANRSPGDVYLLDVLPTVDATGKHAVADISAGYATWLIGTTAVIDKGIAPLPADRQVFPRRVPLGCRIAPGQAVDRRLDIPLPLAERNPYYGDLPLKDYEEREVTAVRFVVQFLRATVDGFGAEPSRFGEGLFLVYGSNTAAQAETLATTFPTRGLVMLRRGDAFPRPAL